MALARVKTWSGGDILSANDLNVEFNNILNNPVSLVSPWTSAMNGGGYALTNLSSTSVGSGADLVTISDTGITLAANARVNKIMNLGIDGLATGSTAPTVNRTGNFYGYAFTIGDDGFIRSFEAPYEADLASGLTIKIHWFVNEAYAAASGEVRWNIKYTVSTENTDTVDGATTTLDFGDVNIPAVAKTLTETSATIAAGIVAADDVIGMQLTRVALVAGANPTAEPIVVGLELEYVSNKLGE